MIPKLASQLLQLKSHGAHHLRNVIQSSGSSSSGLPWTGLGSSSSSWGGSTGAGGAKFNAGSRFYAGYTGPGRVVTQATSLSSGDGANGQIDDSEDRPPVPSRQGAQAYGPSRWRPRRNSFGSSAPRPTSTSGKPGVLQAQIRSRLKHAFAVEDRPQTPSAPLMSLAPAPKPHRRNSTSVMSTTSPPMLDHPADLQPELSEVVSINDPVRVVPPDFPSVAVPEPIQLHPSESVIGTEDQPDDGDVSQLSSLPMSSEEQEEADRLAMDRRDLELYEAIRAAKDGRSYKALMNAVSELRRSSNSHTVATYNMALFSLCSLRAKGAPIAVILELYNEMLERNVLPNVRTYASVIRALCARDHDIHNLAIDASLGKRSRALQFDQHHKELQAEDNFGSAMALFNAARTLKNQSFPVETYNSLLLSASFRGDIDAAIRIYTHLERRSDIHPEAATFSHLIGVYAEAGDLEGAREVFNEFRLASRTGRISWKLGDSDGKQSIAVTRMNHTAGRAHMRVYNRMLSAYFKCGEPAGALALLEEMVNSNSGVDFGPGDVPSPSSSTYTEIIAGFCANGDLDSALTWFDRLLTYHDTSPNTDPYVASNVPLRPDQNAWKIILNSMAQAGRVEDLNRLFAIMLTCVPQEGFNILPHDISLVVQTNMKVLLSDNVAEDMDRALSLINFLNQILPKCALLSHLSRAQIYAYQWLVTKALIRIGKLDEAAQSMLSIVRNEVQDIVNLQGSGGSENIQLQELRGSVIECARELMGVETATVTTPGNPSLQVGLQLMKILRELGIPISVPLQGAIVRAYLQAKSDGQPLRISTRRDWLIISKAFFDVHASLVSPLSIPQVVTDRRELKKLFPETAPFPGLESFVYDIRSEERFTSYDISLIFFRLRRVYGIERARQIMRILGPAGQQAMYGGFPEVPDAASLQAETTVPLAELINGGPGEVVADLISLPDSTNRSGDSEGSSETTDIATTPESTTSAENTTSSANIKIDYTLSNQIDLHRARADYPAIRAYRLLVNEAAKGIYPTPECVGRLMNSLARSNNMEEMRGLYLLAQKLLVGLDQDKEWQARAWCTIEDQMLMGQSAAGDMESANLHRTRIIEHGGVPSADSYASLILHTSDTTDDCSVAMGLYNEAMSLGVIPSVYLYNNLISKLARARKAEAALVIFQEMKKKGVRPTSVTYGALIGACCRVGDAESAMYLFGEMSSQVNFKPKAPPFNTMMQFFVHTKPDRELALHYYNLMVASKVDPTAHTYKLLMDCYGMIEPVDMEAMQMVFEKLCLTQEFQVQGTHWASLITAWGCSCKDVERAMALFDSIPSHPSTLASGAELPDAQTWEALMNVLVSQHRVDLLPSVLHRLQTSGIHMTAYIANVIIRGYAAGGRMAEAREVFEGLQDPPVGLAAVYNHAPHSARNTAIAKDAPVYREPSTWEAMVRAEMGAGELQRAEELLKRMESRGFPAAVEDRIKSIVGQTVATSHPAEWNVRVNALNLMSELQSPTSNPLRLPFLPTGDESARLRQVSAGIA